MQCIGVSFFLNPFPLPKVVQYVCFLRIHDYQFSILGPSLIRFLIYCNFEQHCFLYLLHRCRSTTFRHNFIAAPYSLPLLSLIIFLEFFLYRIISPQQNIQKSKKWLVQGYQSVMSIYVCCLFVVFFLCVIFFVRQL